MSRQDDIQKLISNHQRRLQLLQEQQALRGLSTPPDVVIEIEDVEAQIQALQAELEIIRQSSVATSQVTASPPGTVLPVSIPLEPPYGTMPPNSPFYIERPADSVCWNHLNRGRATTLYVQAPRQMGKSSLMRRMTLLHAIVSFAFVLVILGYTVNAINTLL